MNPFLFADNHHNRHNHHDRPAAIEEEKPLTSNCNSMPAIVKNDLEKTGNEDWKLEESMKKGDGNNEALAEAESYTVIIREHENKHHGHTHSHGIKNFF